MLVIDEVIRLLALLYIFVSNVNSEVLIDQRLRDQQRLKPPPSPFFNTFYDKSYYIPGQQKPVYHVIEIRIISC